MKPVNLKNYSKQLLNYTALATAFLSTSSFDALSQCGNTLPGAPLEIDIDGDGVTDVTFVQNTTFQNYLQTQVQTVIGRISLPAFNYFGFNDFLYLYGSLSLNIVSMNGINSIYNVYNNPYSLYYFTYFPPSPIAVPAGDTFFPLSCPSGAVATADISYGYSYYLSVFGKYLYRLGYRLYYGSAYALPGQVMPLLVCLHLLMFVWLH